MDKQTKIKKYFNQRQHLKLSNAAYKKQLAAYADFILSADWGGRGDITSKLLLDNNRTIKAEIVAKETGILSGVAEVVWLGKKFGLKILRAKKDGKKISKGERVLEFSGEIKNILKTERILLNIIQRMSGIATTTAEAVRLVGKKVLLVSTRKTPLGLLDKKAVTDGGGGTHRLGLHDFVLVKDNHLDAAGINKNQALALLLEKKIFWEVEARSLAEAKQVAGFAPDVIMLDNFLPAAAKITAQVLKQKYPQMILEVSGGITIKNLKNYANIGVDVISLGSLTHSARVLDFSLNLR